ncbi:uncharacterized protein BP5553_08092 [Venustampulla echinocandica]|uniref:Uncharacterized protein n=1 Tax=Venustampulla echinocandica TaxID=2656787 RepID=A0A370TFP9_9HELO|nr:uncharacterized protein BP5553_08092 [Venustampulla echinocandica]RDL33724.1 hypothetical protein BP5553_08092 [Venustampulla echinocandica]
MLKAYGEDGFYGTDKDQRTQIKFALNDLLAEVISEADGIVLTLAAVAKVDMATNFKPVLVSWTKQLVRLSYILFRNPATNAPRPSVLYVIRRTPTRPSLAADLLANARGAAMIQGTISLDEEDEENCTFILPGIQYKLGEWRWREKAIAAALEAFTAVREEEKRVFGVKSFYYYKEQLVLLGIPMPAVVPDPDVVDDEGLEQGGEEGLLFAEEAEEAEGGIRM